MRNQPNRTSNLEVTFMLKTKSNKKVMNQTQVNSTEIRFLYPNPSSPEIRIRWWWRYCKEDMRHFKKWVHWPRISESCSEVVGYSESIWWHSSCNTFTAFLSMLGIGGKSPSDQVGSVLAAAMTAPSTKLTPSCDNRPATNVKQIDHLIC